MSLQTFTKLQSFREVARTQVREALCSGEERWPEIHWKRLELLLLRWSDEQCNKALHAGRRDIFADISKLYSTFSGHWDAHAGGFCAEKLGIASGDDRWDILKQCVFNELVEELTQSFEGAGPKMLRPFDRQRIRSSAYELTHYLLNLRQRLKPPTGKADDSIDRKPLLTHMLKVHSGERTQPKRVIELNSEIKRYLEDPGFRLKEVPAEAREWEIIQRPEGIEWATDVWGRFLDKIGIEKVALFQWQCFTELLEGGLFSVGSPKPLMITAGTGFGKTEAFLFPILFYSMVNLLRRRKRGDLYGPDAILVYPRVDLCNNQLERYLWYAYCLKQAVRGSDYTSDVVPPDVANGKNLDTAFGVAIGHSRLGTSDQEQSFKVECPMCKFGGTEGWIQIRAVKGGGGRWAKKVEPFCSANEEHSEEARTLLVPGLRQEYTTNPFAVAITTADTLHRRLMDPHGAKTLWKNERFLPRFVIIDEIHIYAGQSGSHLANLVRRLRKYLKQIGPRNDSQPNDLAPIFVGASATIGNPEQVAAGIFGVPESEMTNRIIRPGSEDTAELGMEYTYILKTPPVREIKEGVDGNSGRIVAEQSSLLQSLMVIWHAMRKRGSSAEGSKKHRLLTFVDSIDTVWRVARNLDDAEGKKKLYQLRLPRGRWGHDEDLGDNEGNRDCPRFARHEICESPPHQFFERCEIYQKGECWWQMGSDPDPREFLRPMKISCRQSGFTQQPPNSEDGNPDEWDCMIATSTLEVGFDHPELIATAQFKAPPSPASFQQRKGRGGRSPDDMPLTLMVLGNSPGDLFAFKNVDRYVNPTPKDLRMEFDPQNAFIRNQHVMSAMYDFLSWSGIHSERTSKEVYGKCDVYSARNRLVENLAEVRHWVTDMYQADGLDHDECKRLVDECLKQMEDSLFDLTNQNWPDPRGRRIQNSRELFVSVSEAQKAEWRIKLSDKIDRGKADLGDEDSLRVLRAAESFTGMATREFPPGYLHPPDYFSAMPIDRNGDPRDPSWIVPKNFIPTPLGGYINVEGAGSSKEEPKLQTLASFLPGGFKHRWKFSLWGSVPKPVKDQGPNYADVSDMARNAVELGTLRDQLGDREIPAVLSGFDPEKTFLIDPVTIKVSRMLEHGHALTKDRSRIKSPDDKTPGVPLVKEPTATTQTYDLIVDEGSRSGEVSHDGEELGVESVTFGERRLLRLFSSNLVSCYPKKQDPVSFNVRFYDRQKDRHAIPTVQLHTEGISLTGELDESGVERLMVRCGEAGMLEEHFWRLTYRLIWRDVFLNGALTGFQISYSFDCIKLFRALRFLEMEFKKADKSLEEVRSADDLREQVESAREVCRQLELDIFDANIIDAALVPQWDRFREVVLSQARKKLREEIVASYAQSLGMAVCRDIADETNTNLDLLRVSTEAHVSGGESFFFRVCVYDDIEGGNGTTAAYVRGGGNSLSLNEICRRQKDCSTARDEEAILGVLLDPTIEPEMLGALTDDSELCRKHGLTETGLFRLARLTSEPAIAAFYQGTAEAYDSLRKDLGRIPGEEELGCYMQDRPMPDPRALHLFKKFSERVGGISELTPRISEIIPLCKGSCPDCLGDSQLSYMTGDRISADRCLIDA